MWDLRAGAAPSGRQRRWWRDSDADGNGDDDDDGDNDYGGKGVLRVSMSVCVAARQGNLWYK